MNQNKTDKDLNKKSHNNLAEKAKRLMVATFLISEILKDTNQIKASLRSTSIDLYEEATTGNGSVCINLLMRLNGYYFVLKNLNQLPDENFEILDNECRKLIEHVEMEYRLGDNSILELLQAGKIHKGHKGHEMTDRISLSRRGDNSAFNSSVRTLSNSNSQQDKLPNGINMRRSAILSIVRKIGTVGIKDIALTLSDISEKTIQRELVAMVNEGILRKDGDRRWSRYSVVAK